MDHILYYRGLANKTNDGLLEKTGAESCWLQYSGGNCLNAKHGEESLA